MTPAAATTTSRAAAAAADSGPDPRRPVPDEIAVKVLEVEVTMKVVDFFSDGQLAQRALDNVFGFSLVQRVAGRLGRLLEDQDE